MNPVTMILWMLFGIPAALLLQTILLSVFAVRLGLFSRILVIGLNLGCWIGLFFSIILIDERLGVLSHETISTVVFLLSWLTAVALPWLGLRTKYYRDTKPQISI